MREHTIRLAAVSILLLGLIAPAGWSQNTVQTIGGGGPNNLPALKSSMGNPISVAVDAAGNVYVLDLYSTRIFRVDIAGNVTVVAGNGTHGYGIGGGPATKTDLGHPTGFAVDASGNIFISDSTSCTIRKVSAQTGTISAVAGTGDCTYFGDGGPATSAKLNQPTGVAVDGSGNIFIADTCVVRKVSVQTGNISAISGTPPDPSGTWRCGYSGDGGLAINAKLGLSDGLVVDRSGNLFIADTSNCAIREISAVTGVISTVAGTGSCGYSGDGGPATSAMLAEPKRVAVDEAGNIFLTDASNCVIRKVSSSNLQISTVAGTGSCGYSGDGGTAIAATLNQPTGVAVDGSGNIFIADSENSAVRTVSVSTGNISTFAGVTVPDPYHSGQMIGFRAYSGDGYPATDGQFGFGYVSRSPSGIATDHSGNVFVADTLNHAIRKIDASTGIMTTVSGNGFDGFSGDGGPAGSAQLSYPRDVAVDSSGNIYIMDGGNCVVRKISADTGIISTVAGRAPEISGNYIYYHCGYSGDGGPAVDAEIFPWGVNDTPAGGVAVDGSGNIFIADTYPRVIRKVSATTGVISTVAGVPFTNYVGTGDGGPATMATLNEPHGVSVDDAGNIFIADTDDDAIREVMAVNGNIYTVAGSVTLGPGLPGDGGPATSARLGHVYSMYVDAAGNLFIPDRCVIRRVSGSTGVISTVGGLWYPGHCEYSGDDGPALSAGFDDPQSVAADASGNLLVLDGIRVRTVPGLVQAPASGAVLFPDPLIFTSAAVGTSDTLTVMLSNRGSLPTSVFSVAISGTNASDFSQTDNCAGRSIAAGGGSCEINVRFTSSVAAPESAVLTVTDSAGTQTVDLSGAGIDFSVTAASSGSLSASVAQGETAFYSLQVTALGGRSDADQISVHIACAGAPPRANCSSSRVIDVQRSHPTPLTFFVTTAVPSRTSALPGRGHRTDVPLRVLEAGIMTCVVFLPFASLGSCRLTRRRRHLARLALLVPMILVIALVLGCGGGGTGDSPGPPPSVGGTPAGTYTLTLTATSGKLSHTTALTLVVTAAR